MELWEEPGKLPTIDFLIFESLFDFRDVFVFRNNSLTFLVGKGMVGPHRTTAENHAFQL